MDLDIVVLISGRGSNLKSLIDKAKSYSIKAVISNKPDAPGLGFAREAAIPAFAFDRRDYGSVKEQKQAIWKKIEELSPGLVALAGFMLIVDAEFIERCSGRIVNIHPSLLPAYPGLDTHRRVLDAKEARHGCSVHYVDGGVDTGPLIAQAQCDCSEGDDVEKLSSRVLALEHELYPWAIDAIARKLIWLENGAVKYSPDARLEAAERGFRIFS